MIGKFEGKLTTNLGNTLIEKYSEIDNTGIFFKQTTGQVVMSKAGERGGAGGAKYLGPGLVWGFPKP